jgi:hypothetical protein
MPFIHNSFGLKDGTKRKMGSSKQPGKTAFAGILHLLKSSFITRGEINACYVIRTKVLKPFYFELPLIFLYFQENS